MSVTPMVVTKKGVKRRAWHYAKPALMILSRLTGKCRFLFSSTRTPKDESHCSDSANVRHLISNLMELIFVFSLSSAAENSTPDSEEK
jgi:hypothetical protein